MRKSRAAWFAAWFLTVLTILMTALPAVSYAEEAASTRWADASDEIDRYLDTAFEDFLAGMPISASMRQPGLSARR